MPSQESISARINFGIPNSEYIVRVDSITSEAISCYNQDTNTEYIGGGGGGDSDFSTAEVTVRKAAGTDYNSNLTLPCIENNHICGLYFDALHLPESVTVTAALLNGKCVIFCDSLDYGVSGNITYDSEIRGYAITGDCVITIG